MMNTAARVRRTGLAGFNPSSSSTPRRAVRTLSATFLAAALLCPTGTARVEGQPAAVGQWSAIQAWPRTAVHTHLLPTGKVMFWAYSDGVSQWDPATGALSALPNAGYNIFCTGHTFTADGRLFVTGGHIVNGEGLEYAAYYDPFANTWTRLPNMNNKRWYPSSNILPNGDVLVTSGSYDPNYSNNTLPQVWQVASGTWRNLTGANLAMMLYPRQFPAPDGRVFFATYTSRYLDPSGTGAWTTVATHRTSGRENYGSAVLYAPGKVLFAGGGDPPTATAEVIDLNTAVPAWRLVGSMAAARRQNNLTLLPDGKVLCTGGSSAPEFDNPAGAVLFAELWNPATELWSTLASHQEYRGYHSTALLLPDGRVLSAGGDNHSNAEVYSPPYLFQGSRPTITSAPATLTLGQAFDIVTPDAAGVSTVSLLRLGTVTHAHNMDQNFNRLAFTAGAGTVSAVAPTRANDCPPGYYLLFILRPVNGVEVPSVARIVRVTNAPPPPIPSAPSGLAATVASSTQANLTWVDTASNEDGFRIERAPGSAPAGGDWVQVGSVGPNTAAWSDTGLAPSVTYTFRVLAFNSGGESAPSNSATVTTPPLPNPPSNLRATAVSRSQINLTWIDASTDETGFRIERSENNSTWVLVTTRPAGATSYSDTGLVRNRLYYYRARAANANGVSAPSNTASARTLKR